jgi:pyruvate/2-oxoglutarate dehydrogenase complex dihydrolipoamide dehydrogenase (E3) component
MTMGKTAGARPITCDLCIIGAGSAGLSLAAGAAQMGASVVLIERGTMGGDCLNTGCVPSKSLIAAARAAHVAQEAGHFGIRYAPPAVDFRAVHAHVHGVIARIAPHDSVERFTELGVRVLRAEAAFSGPNEVVAGDARIVARRYVIASGSRAALPPIDGLAEAGPLTNDTLFALQELPRHLLVIGGGPVGLEMAQAFRRLGSAVSVVERATILPRDEPEAVEIIRSVLRREAIEFVENTAVTRVRRAADGVHVDIASGGITRTLSGSHLLVAAGRRAETAGLGLAAAGVTVGPRGITVDRRLRTSNRRIYAIGDVAGGPQFTHVAGYHAGIVLRGAVLGLPARVDYAALPWVTYLDPEVAHVGLTEAEARAAHGPVSVLLDSFATNDRAQAERRTEGLIKIVLGRRGRILGATIVAPHSGEMIGLWGLAIANRLPVSAVARMIAPYPTFSELSKRVAAGRFTPVLFGKRVRAVVRLVQRWLP